MKSGEKTTETERERKLEAFLFNVSTWLECGDAGRLTKERLREIADELMVPVRAEIDAHNARHNPEVPRG